MDNILFVPGLIYPKCPRWSMRVDSMGNDPVQGSLVNIATKQLRKLMTKFSCIYKLQDEEKFFVFGSRVVQANTSPENFYEVVKDLEQNLTFWIRTQDMDREDVRLGSSLQVDTAPYFLFDTEKSVRISIAEIHGWTIDNTEKSISENVCDLTKSDDPEAFYKQTLREFDILMVGMRQLVVDNSRLQHFAVTRDLLKTPLSSLRNKSEMVNIYSLMSQVNNSILLNAIPPMSWIMSQVETIKQLKDVLEVVPSTPSRSQSLARGIKARISLNFKSRDGIDRLGGEVSIEFGLLSGAYSICDYKPPKNLLLNPGWNHVAPGLMVDIDSKPITGVINTRENTSWYFEKIMQRQPTKAFSILLDCIKKQFGNDREFGTNFPVKEFQNA